MVHFRLFSLVCAMLFVTMPLVAGFSHAAKTATVAALKLNSKTLLTKSPLHVFGNIDGFAHKVDGACAFLENTRGRNGKAAYPAQDRVAVGHLKGNAFFGLFDGHGTKGDVVATFVQNELMRRVLLSKNPAESLEQAIADVQGMLKNNTDAQRAGTTAVAAVLEDTNKLTVANVGDSRLIVIRNKEVIFATRDHKPTDPLETERVIKNGGYVSGGRVWSANGSGFALARSMGDISSQGTALIALPDIGSVQLQQSDMIILASDGVWDVFANEQVIRFIEEGGTLQEIADRIVQEARAEGSKDDITVLVSCIK